MINYDADFARVNIEFTSRYGSADIAVVLSKKRKKAVARQQRPYIEDRGAFGVSQRRLFFARRNQGYQNVPCGQTEIS